MREFKSNQDIYDYAEEMILIARDQGDEETVLSLQGALHENFITSEILGELVIALEGLQSERSKEYLHPHHADISDAIHAIRKAFKKANRPK